MKRDEPTAPAPAKARPSRAMHAPYRAEGEPVEMRSTLHWLASAGALSGPSPWKAVAGSLGFLAGFLTLLALVISGVVAIGMFLIGVGH